MCSRIFEQMQAKEMGLQLLGIAQLPFLEMGTICTLFQSDGKEHWFNNSWKIRVSEGASSLDFFKNSARNSSGPVTL